jgi:hypothetical protein
LFLSQRKEKKGLESPRHILEFGVSAVDVETWADNCVDSPVEMGFICHTNTRHPGCIPGLNASGTTQEKDP